MLSLSNLVTVISNDYANGVTICAILLEIFFNECNM
jgi:hypothetical protein